MRDQHSARSEQQPGQTAREFRCGKQSFAPVLNASTLSSTGALLPPLPDRTMFIFCAVIQKRASDICALASQCAAFKQRSMNATIIKLSARHIVCFGSVKIQHASKRPSCQLLCSLTEPRGWNCGHDQLLTFILIQHWIIISSRSVVSIACGKCVTRWCQHHGLRRACPGRGS